MYSLHKQGMPILAPIDQRAVTRAVRTDSKLSGRLYGELGVDMQKLKKTIRREISIGISIGSDYNMIARQVQISSGIPLKRAKTIVRTEGHRIQQQSADDARNAAKAQGCQVVKQWDAVLDGNTRTDHRILDGQIREVGEPFEIDGKKAEYPGAFGRPEEDCNCRCVALTRARWGLDEAELQTMKDRAKFFGLDKTENFKEFEEKYLNAADTLKKQGESGIIEAGNFAIPMQKFVGYALNPQNAPDKARVFKSALGYDISNADALIQNIITHADETKFTEKGDSGYGMRYEYIMELTGANGKQANVLTAWIRQNGKLRLTSVYVTKRRRAE